MPQHSISHTHRVNNNVPTDHAGHSHGGHREAIQDVSDHRLLWAIALNHLLTIGQVIAGFLSGSMALVSDAAHNFNDANSLLIAYIARRISRNDANERYTFGYRRAEMIGAMINLTLLAVIGLFLVYQGIRHLFFPQQIIGQLMAITAVIALVVDVGTAFLLRSMSHGSLNVRAAFIHNIVDAAGSVAVLIGAAAIIWLEWRWVDPVITLLIAIYVLWQVCKMFPQTTRVLMEGAPPDVKLKELIESVEQISGVEELHHLHVWELDERTRALEAHVVIAEQSAVKLESIKCEIKSLLGTRFKIGHSTLEFELSDSNGSNCNDDGVISAHE
ncbi:cation transporter [Rhodopirellula sp. SM50]|nr:cation diffusion facilitator family transporter [Rhodopirellula sp. SM50]PAY15942.1 cation transporter [Rhodopirellula sp. SM50]